jgi:hypothetical protein
MGRSSIARWLPCGKFARVSFLTELGAFTGPRCGPAAASLQWAALLKRVFALDSCAALAVGARRIVAGHTRPETLRPLLAWLALTSAVAGGDRENRAVRRRES